MNRHFMVDQADRHDSGPSGHDAKLARAREYLKARNIAATQPGNDLRYVRSERGSRVLRKLVRKAA